MTWTWAATKSPSTSRTLDPVFCVRIFALGSIQHVLEALRSRGGVGIVLDIFRSKQSIDGSGVYGAEHFGINSPYQAQVGQFLFSSRGHIASMHREPSHRSAGRKILPAMPVWNFGATGVHLP